jgi:Recombination endonuclease VII
MCQNHYRRAQRAERGLKKPGPKTGIQHDWSSAAPRSTDEQCARGHAWSEHTEAFTTGKKRYCRYCSYVATAVEQGRKYRDLESWIEWRERREEFCKRGHPRTEENIRVDPKTKSRICRVCDVDNRRKKNYGMEPAAYESLWEAQDGKCAGCLVEFSELDPFDIHIDHDHTDGHIRGLLCSGCNLGLGKLKDDPAVLRRLLEYLEGCGV